jgi:lipid II:glycine glycyltransferase (peptidoglycan interpeptide bridge formation enzyme)
MSAPASAPEPELVELGPAVTESWDRFVFEHPDGSVYHLSAWAEILRRAYRFEPRYLVLRDADDAIAGVMPLVSKTGPIAGSRLNSLPVVRWAGPLARTPAAEASLVRAACELVDDGDAQRLHIASPSSGLERWHPGLSAAEAYPTWSIDLPSDVEAFRERFRKHSKSLPRNVRRAEREGVTVREGRSPDDLRSFYRLYLETMRKRRSLPRSLRQLQVAQELLEPSGAFRLFVAELDGRIVAGGIFHFFRDTVDLLYNASDERYLQARPNHALHWEVIAIAIEQGMRIFDLGVGRPGKSLAEFKRRWGAEPVPRWEYTYPERQSAATGKAIASTRRIRRGQSPLAARAWQRIPLSVTRVAGAIAYRYL